MEQLESRRLLADASVVTHTFREDDFSLGGTFSYRLQNPAEHGYIDTINNGRYASTSGHVKWTSATQGTGFFVGTATGDGRDTVDSGGRRNCSEYGIEDQGRMDFSINALTSTLRMENTVATSTRYTYYRDLTGGRCPQPDPPWSRFFGGTAQLYAGTFSPANHQVAVRYNEASPEVAVDAPPADMAWSTTTATDLALTAVPLRSVPEVPTGFAGVPQTTQPPATPSFVDLRQGGLELTVQLTGKPARTATPQTPVATVRAYWASSDTDTSGPEIPITSVASPVGLFWNSARLQATIWQFLAPPPTARFLRITLDAPAAVDADPANSTRFLRIGEFQARSPLASPVGENTVYQGIADSLLHSLDRTDPAIRVFAYQTTSGLGAPVQVLSDRGAFTYDPTVVPAIQALGLGDVLNDTVRFVAIKNQTLLSEATLTIPVLGENDPPIANVDQGVTTNFQKLSILPAQLLANDTDPDQNDSVKLKSVSEQSDLGAAITIVLNDAFSEIEHITYDPASSAVLRRLAFGQKMLDQISYKIVDRFGGESTSSLIIEVTGEERFLSIQPIATQYTTAGLATGPVRVVLDDPDGDSTGVQFTAIAQDGNLVPASGSEVIRRDGEFWLTITPAPAVTGRTMITLTARDGTQSATTRFLLVVGTETDLDLDGVPNSVEDAAPHGGDMNQDGMADSRQANVTSLRTLPGSFVNLVQEGSSLANVAVEAAPTPAGTASGAVFPIGLLKLDVLADAPNTVTTVTIRTDDAQMPLNRVFSVDGLAGPSWRSLMHNKQDGARILADRVVLSLRDGGRGDGDQAVDGLIRTSLALGHVARPWQNLVREDIDNDGIVAPIDALLLVNQLNNHGPRSLGSRPTGTESLPNFLDPSGSNSLEPIDALIVINFLNSRASGEGDSASATFQDSRIGILTASLGGDRLGGVGIPPKVTRRERPSVQARWWEVDEAWISYDSPTSTEHDPRRFGQHVCVEDLDVLFTTWSCLPGQLT